MTSPSQVRETVRAEQLTGNTSGMARGFVQCNLAILPQALANDFEQFCLANPKPCPIIAKSNHAGDYQLTNSAIDIRTDFPKYCLFKDGKRVDEVNDIRPYWRDDMVAFLLGCSFSFEEALQDAGIEIRNITEQKNVPMYKTNIACKSVGVFSSNMVVSMRPMKAVDAINAIQICAQFPSVHGAPIHLGNPQLIGINDLNQPDFGDCVTVNPDEIPVFWACGVTPQLAIANAKPKFSITHSPGCMLVTDIPNSSLRTNGVCQ